MDTITSSISGFSKISPDFSKQLAQCIDEDKDFKTNTTPEGAFGAVFGKYVIRRDDLNFLEELANSVETAASVGFFAVAVPSHALLAAKVGITISLLKVFIRLKDKGAVLSDEELQVLLFVKSLKSNSGVTCAEIADRLELKGEDVQATLRRLSQYPVGDGSSKEFVESNEGNWRATV